jgi:hypothetical protein
LLNELADADTFGFGGQLQPTTQPVGHPHANQRGPAILWFAPCAFATSSMGFPLLRHPKSKKSLKLILVNANQGQSKRLYLILNLVNFNHDFTEPHHTTGPGEPTPSRYSPA